jgi:transcriptional regulator with PAS, ATPase and Fis domain
MSAWKRVFCYNNRTQKYKVTIHPISLNGTVDRYVIKFIEPLKSTVSIRDHQEAAAAHFQFSNIIGSSKSMRQVIEKAKLYAGSEENILIIGESGTGKELIAQAIHNKRRPEGPFVAINCSALPRDLAISELFGYEGGSFSGADRKGRAGKIELAHGGTLFLR